MELRHNIAVHVMSLPQLFAFRLAMPWVPHAKYGNIAGNQASLIN